MPNSYFSNYAGNRALHAVFGPGLYLALHEDEPTPTGLLSTEVGGAGYQREPIAFASPSGQAIVSVNSQTFAALPKTLVKWLAVWDSPGHGNMVMAMQLSPAITVPESGQVLVAPGDVSYQLITVLN